MPPVKGRPRLPSLLALRAFDAASRHSSFTRAAEELHLTQSAISRHIRNLESDIDAQLFNRKGRSVTLTPEGLRMMTIVGEAFDRMSGGIEEIRRSRLAIKFTVSLLPSLAAKWLAPRIGAFSALHPDIEINIHCSRTLVDLERDDIDMAIRYGPGTWPRCDSQLLLSERMLPVCSPSLASELGIRPQLQSVLSMPLLHGDNPERWQDFFSASGLTDFKIPNGPVFSDDNALVQAAVDGQGFILGRSLLVSRDLAAGRLVAPFSCDIPASYSYWLVTAKGKTETGVVKTFKKFLIDEANSIREAET